MAETQSDELSSFTLLFTSFSLGLVMLVYAGRVPSGRPSALLAVSFLAQLAEATALVVLTMSVAFLVSNGLWVGMQKLSTATRTVLDRRKRDERA